MYVFTLSLRCTIPLLLVCCCHLVFAYAHTFSCVMVFNLLCANVSATFFPLSSSFSPSFCERVWEGESDRASHSTQSVNGTMIVTRERPEKCRWGNVLAQIHETAEHLSARQGGVYSSVNTCSLSLSISRSRKSLYKLLLWILQWTIWIERVVFLLSYLLTHHSSYLDNV